MRTKDSAISLEIPRNLGMLCQKPESRPSVRTKDALVLLSLSETARALGALCRELRAGTNIHFFYHLRITKNSWSRRILTLRPPRLGSPSCPESLKAQHPLHWTAGFLLAFTPHTQSFAKCTAAVSPYPVISALRHCPDLAPHPLPGFYNVSVLAPCLQCLPRGHAALINPPKASSDAASPLFKELH